MALPTTGLLGQWGFDDGAGNIVTDYSGNGNHATIQGPAQQYAWSAKGLAISTSCYITAPHLDFYTGKQFTFIVACKFAFATNTPTLMGHEDEAQIYLSNNNKAVTFYTESPETELIVSTKNVLVAGTDIVIAVTYDNANFKTYLDGVLNNTVAGANKITDGSGNFKFSDSAAGYRDSYTFYYALVYDRALTGAEIADIYDFIQSEISSRGGQVVTPGGIASQGVLGAPAITPGNVGLPLGGIAPTQLTGLLTLVPGGVILGLNGIPSSEQLGIPILDSGAAALRPSGIPSGIQVGIPNIITGIPATKYIFPVSLISIDSIGSPTMIRTFKLALPGIGNISFFGVPTITHSSFQMIELLGVENITYLGQPRLGALLILGDISPTLQIGDLTFIQALCYVKVNGVWLLGEVRLKIDGGWQNATDLLPKVEGNWKFKEVS